MGAMGSSLGGCISILTATKDKRIKALATWATPSYLSELFSKEITRRFQNFLDYVKTRYN